jgi:hypothetical protein
MLLLPVADPLGVLGVPEVILVRRLGQPGPLELALSGLAAGGFETISLTLSTPVIGKKKSVAVQALVPRSGRLHRFIASKIKRNHYRKTGGADGRKSSRNKIQNGEEGRRDFSESFEENPGEEDPVSDRQFCIHSILTAAKSAL